MQQQPGYQQKISKKFEAERWRIVDECSFSIVVIKFLAHIGCKEMDLCPIRAFFFEESLPFWTNLSQSQIRRV